MSFELLFHIVEQVDSWLTGLFDGAPLPVALGIAFLLGVRHASDPDHLVAVTSLVATEGGETRAAARLGAWWGTGHAAVLLLVGMPLILGKSQLPVWIESGAEKAIGVVILALALRVIGKWLRGDYRVSRHRHPDRPRHRHLHRAEDGIQPHTHGSLRTPRQAFGIGVLHGLAGTGAVVLLLITALPTQIEAAAALAVFAPMSMLSMTACTTVFAWALTRPLLEPVYRQVLIPALGVFGLIFGLWYAGIT